MHNHPDCKNWEAVGHSLGGRVANEIGLRHPEVKVTSGRLNPGESILSGAEIKMRNSFNHTNHLLTGKNITSHKILGDPISWNHSSGTNIIHAPHYNSVNNYLNPLNNHSLTNFIN